MGLSKNKINVSIIGAGLMAEEHIKAIQKFKNLKILGIMSKKNVNAKKLAKKYKIKFVCKNIKEMYTKTFSKILIIVVPVSETKKIVLKALHYPWKILAEKPLGLDQSESKKILKVCKKLKRMNDVAVGFNRRNYDTTKFIKKDIDDSSSRLVQIFDQQNIFNRSVKLQPLKIKKNWMFANSTHLIDYAIIFCRGKISSAKKNIYNLGNKAKIITFSAKYTSGDTLIYNALWNIPGPRSVIITNKTKSYKLEPLESLFIKDSNAKKYKKVRIITKDEKLGIKIGLFNQTNELLNFIKNKKHNLCLIGDSNDTMTLTKRIYS